MSHQPEPHHQANGTANGHQDEHGDIYAQAMTYTYSHTTTIPAPPELGGDKTYAILKGTIDEHFVSSWAPFGGYILALCVEAVRFEVRRLGLDKRFHEPIAMGATLVQAGRDGPFVASVHPIRVGGRFAFFEVALRQAAPPPRGAATNANGPADETTPQYVTMATGRVTMSDLTLEQGAYTILSNDGRTPVTSPFDPPVFQWPWMADYPQGTGASAAPGPSPFPPDSATPWDPSKRVGLGLPPLSACHPRSWNEKHGWKVSTRTGKSMEHLIETRDMPYREGEYYSLESGGDWCKWVRLLPPASSPHTTSSLAFFSDYWNSIVGWVRRPSDKDGFMPTIEFQIQFRSIPKPTTQWLLLCTRNRMATHGKREWDVEIWDEEGRLLSVARQLCATASSKNAYRLAEKGAKGEE
ncbi:hypothetical protein M427DRAFT_62379 [Gonapodya prolifera JEL478]|uniref:Thioesterase/thiol ester dehydrase-isomerase n=1 Tax=Gonapodya prolifera (strain JEL478) TaxID=1344416 RepID=A0A139A220_GONPJ|nr:hypothetical protein M427DRAFT_62379 [Gonapodya prolifera JEL478]|eukprot:KXS10403.1 hypothetical protein M427DRAFT_62379 [Gonapodya prolifera JEL478]